ncbi:MAG: PTS sugar transporter subunit IIA [Epulopiscium sp. Nele67-Bin001]|nr:MAG: PTS sugar transporter subunit IIA [Epulopiscium sp. Nele67-Bin001]
MYFKDKLAIFHLEVANQTELFNVMSNELRKNGYVKESFLSAIIAREEEYPTALFINDTGFAIPHTDSAHVNNSQICFASLKNPIQFSSMVDKDDKIEVNLVFMLAMHKPHEQIDTLQNLMELFQNEPIVARLKECCTQAEFEDILKDGNLIN